MNASHTPAPWSVTPCPSGGVLLQRGEAGRHPQAFLQVVPEADGRLMSLAPELYEALRATQDFLSDPRSCGLTEDELYAKVEAVLAKLSSDSERR